MQWSGFVREAGTIYLAGEGGRNYLLSQRIKTTASNAVEQVREAGTIYLARG
jgi:hypothetical protein